CTLKAYCTSNNGGNDVFLLKLNPAGLGSKDLEYSTYLGGINDDSGYSIAIDSSGNAYVTGETWSSDFPTFNAYNSTFSGIFDAFVAKLNLSGNNQNDLIYSTFIGGTYTECGYSIAVDSIGNAYITGNTDSTDFPTFPNPGAYNNAYNGKGDGFIIKLNSAGSNLLYSTYFGGNDYDESYGIAIDSSGNVYVTGRTYSTNFPTTLGAYDSNYKGGGDVFVLKLNLTSSLPSYSTFISDINSDIGKDIEVDSFGNTYIAGYTTSTNFPTTASNAYDTTHNGDVDVIVIKLNNAGSNLVYSTYIGGADSDWGYGIAIDSNCKIYVTGLTESSYFPNTTGVNHSGSLDCFVVKLEFNNIPQVVDLTVTPSPVFRANSIYIYSNATDAEDLESELVPTFEYRDPGHIIWLNESLSTPTHINNHWQTSRTITKYDPIGEYDFRVRYKDKGLLDSEWFYSNKVLNVLNNVPEIKDLKLSKDKAFQKENISLWVNGSDVEDPEHNLTLWVEYRDPSEVKWNISYLKLETKMYVGDKWEINFSAPFDAPFGYYDFRANITDSDGNYSGCFYAYDALLISNKNPEFLDVGLSGYMVYRNNSVFLYSNCSDHETPKNELKYQAEHKHESDTEWNELLGQYSDDRWESKFNTNISSELGFYYFRVKFEDSVGESTGWQEVEEPLEVLNNLPTISFALDDIEIETNALTIDLTQYESDVEDTNEDLIWSIDETKTYKFLESVIIKDQLNDILEIVPKVNIRREEDIKLTLTDKDGGTDTLSNITISVDSVITIETPKLTLLTPADKNIINTLTPTLTWK
ncbi:MAG: SBBP repeat-containing protein, partial [Thermoplasmata archaeon]|nr:SBBP repeat-containing protein [Thermoplasmata archaeon]